VPNPSAPSTGRPLTADDLFAIQLVSDPRPSPDGSQVAYVVTRLDKEADEYRSAIWLVSTAGGDPVQLTGGTARDSTPRWSPDGSQIAFLSTRPGEPAPETKSDEDADAADATSAPPDLDQTTDQPAAKDGKPKPQVWVIRVAGGEARQITRQQHGTSSPVWSPDGRMLAFLSATDPDDDPERRWTEAPPEQIADERIVTRLSYRYDGRGFFEHRYKHVWTIPATGGKATQLTGGDVDDDQPAWSPNGGRIAFVSNRTPLPERDVNEVSAVYVVPTTGGEPRCLTEGDVFFVEPAWSPDGSRLAFVGHTEPAAGFAKNLNLWTIPAGGGTPENHTAAWDRSFADVGMSDVNVIAELRPIWSPDGQSVAALAASDGTTHVYRVHLASGDVSAVTTGPRRVTAFAFAGDRLVATIGDASHPFELYAANADGSEERQLTDHNRAFLNEVALSPAEEIRFASQAGDLEIQGWVLKPPGFREGVKYPLILQIHGGPHAMYGHAMFHEMQLMAARGYVVLFTNPRGSTGYGEHFSGCTRGRWGEADMPDVLGALDAILERGYVDEARVGVTGGSYGGYLTNWIVGHTERFRAAVTQRCVSNFHSMFGTSDIGFTFGEYEFGGTPWADAEHLLRYSPISYVDRVTTPLLIIHNEGDLRCPIEQAEQLFTALKRLGREVAFVRIPEEDHNLSRTGKPSRRLARLHHLIGWFDNHL